MNELSRLGVYGQLFVRLGSKLMASAIGVDHNTNNNNNNNNKFTWKFGCSSVRPLDQCRKSGENAKAKLKLVLDMKSLTNYVYNHG